MLCVEGERDAPLDLADHDPGRRAALAQTDGIDLALVALSPPLGIEALPTTEAEDLLALVRGDLDVTSAVTSRRVSIKANPIDLQKLRKLL